MERGFQSHVSIQCSFWNNKNALMKYDLSSRVSEDWTSLSRKSQHMKDYDWTILIKTRQSKCYFVLSAEDETI